MIQYLFELIVIPITDGLVIDILSQLFARWLDAQDDD